jgi:hypothetical protein
LLDWASRHGRILPPRTIEPEVLHGFYGAPSLTFFKGGPWVDSPCRDEDWCLSLLKRGIRCPAEKGGVRNAGRDWTIYE